METFKNFIASNVGKAIGFVKGLGRPTLIKCGIAAAVVAGMGLAVTVATGKLEDETVEIVSTEDGFEVKAAEEKTEEKAVEESEE